jgi:hypothetical protein
LFGEAQSEYQAAVKESALEADLTAQAAKLRTNLDEAHAAVAARRQQALAPAPTVSRAMSSTALRPGRSRATTWRPVKISQGGAGVS